MNDDVLPLLPLPIAAIGHVLNSHHLLDKLDIYTRAVQGILSDIRGLGAVPLTSTCPECLMNTSAARKGETAVAVAMKHYAVVVVQRLIDRS